MEEFGVGDISASLGLALYVLGCMFGRKMFFSTLADMFFEMALARCCSLR